MCSGGISRGSQAPQEDRAEVAKAPGDQDNFSEKEIQAILDHVLSGRRVYRLSLQFRRCSSRLWVGAWVNQRELDNRRAPRATSWRYPEQCGVRPAAGCRSARLQRAPEARGLDKHSKFRFKSGDANGQPVPSLLVSRSTRRTRQQVVSWV